VTRNNILNQVQKICQQKYSQTTHWVHDINHVKRVVGNARQLGKMEHLHPKEIFLIELACWLHDLGRVNEDIGLEFLASDHAEKSYLLSKMILLPFEKQIGRESIFKVLQAVREHNLPRLKHPENIVARILLDSDRGAGLNPIGIFTMLNYLKIVKTEPIKTIKQARQNLKNLTQQIRESQKTAITIEKLAYFKDWYYGNNNQSKTGEVVVSLYSDSAKKLYKKGIEEIENYIDYLTKIN
jgi:HD superfamily phosphodiesterase